MLSAVFHLVATMGASVNPRIVIRPAKQASQHLQHSYVIAEVDVPAMFGLWSTSRVVGHVTVREEVDKASECSRVYLSNLRVDDAFRRRPVRIQGRRGSLAIELMQRCESIAREWGYDETHLNVYEWNKSAARLYVDKLDYELVSVKESPSRRKNAVLRMRKQLACGAARGAASTAKQKQLAGAGARLQRLGQGADDSIVEPGELALA